MLTTADLKHARNDIDNLLLTIRSRVMALQEPQKTQSQLDEEARQEEEQREQARKNNDFVQLSRKNMLAIGELIQENHTAARIFMFLAKYADRYNAIMCSSSILEKYTGRSRTTVSTAVKHLKAKGFLTIAKSGNSNVYILNPHVVWSSWRTNKDYCEFTGGILLSKDENPDLEEQMRKQLNMKKEL